MLCNQQDLYSPARSSYLPSPAPYKHAVVTGVRAPFLQRKSCENLTLLWCAFDSRTKYDIDRRQHSPTHTPTHPPAATTQPSPLPRVHLSTTLPRPTPLLGSNRSEIYGGVGHGGPPEQRPIRREEGQAQGDGGGGWSVREGGARSEAHF